MTAFDSRLLNLQIYITEMVVIGELERKQNELVIHTSFKDTPGTVKMRHAFEHVCSVDPVHCTTYASAYIYSCYNYVLALLLNDCCCSIISLLHVIYHGIV